MKRKMVPSLQRGWALGFPTTLHPFQLSFSMQVFGQTPFYTSSTGQWDLWPELPSQLVRKHPLWGERRARRREEGRRVRKELVPHCRGCCSCSRGSDFKPGFTWLLSPMGGAEATGRQGAGKAGRGRGGQAAGMWQGLQHKHLPSSSAWGWHPSLANPTARAPNSPQFPSTSRLLAPSLILSRGLCCRMPAPRLCWPGWRSTACLTSADPASASTSSSARSSWVSCGRRKQVSHCGRHGGKVAGLPLARWLPSMALGWKGTARPFLGGHSKSQVGFP